MVCQQPDCASLLYGTYAPYYWQGKRAGGAGGDLNHLGLDHPIIPSSETRINIRLGDVVWGKWQWLSK